MNLVGYIEDALNRLSNLGEFSKSLVTIASAAGVVLFLIYSIRILFSLIQGKQYLNISKQVQQCAKLTPHSEIL